MDSFSWRFNLFATFFLCLKLFVILVHILVKKYILFFSLECFLKNENKTNTNINKAWNHGNDWKTHVISLKCSKFNTSTTKRNTTWSSCLNHLFYSYDSDRIMVVINHFNNSQWLPLPFHLNQSLMLKTLCLVCYSTYIIPGRHLYFKNQRGFLSTTYLLSLPICLIINQMNFSL